MAPRPRRTGAAGHRAAVPLTPLPPLPLPLPLPPIPTPAPPSYPCPYPCPYTGAPRSICYVKAQRICPLKLVNQPCQVNLSINLVKSTFKLVNLVLDVKSHFRTLLQFLNVPPILGAEGREAPPPPPRSHRARQNAARVVHPSAPHRRQSRPLLCIDVVLLCPKLQSYEITTRGIADSCPCNSSLW